MGGNPRAALSDPWRRKPALRDDTDPAHAALSALGTSRLALAAVLLGLGLVSLLLWQRQLTAQQERVTERVDYQAHNLARQREASLHDQIAGLRRIALQWNHRERIWLDGPAARSSPSTD